MHPGCARTIADVKITPRKARSGTMPGHSLSPLRRTEFAIGDHVPPLAIAFAVGLAVSVAACIGDPEPAGPPVRHPGPTADGTAWSAVRPRDGAGLPLQLERNWFL